jgi:hypothetical protein
MIRQLLIFTFFVYFCVDSYGQTVFHYQVSQGSGAMLPLIPDVGGAGNDGTGDATTKLSSDVPTAGVPVGAGSRAIDGRGQGGVISAGIDELSNSLIADAGGFSMETWFFWKGGGQVNSLIDYAGTEKLVLDTRTGNSEVAMRINSDPSLDSPIGSVSPDEWHYAAAVFDTQGNAVEGGSIDGVFRLYFDGALVNTTETLTITDFGDSLDRGIGVSKHPLNFESDRFDGLIFEPRVSLAALSQDDLLYVVPEPTISCFSLFLIGLVSIRRSRRSEKGTTI